MTTIAHQWQHITDLPSDWNKLGDPTLRHLGKVWNDQKDSLDASARKRFLDKQQRQWAIETGLIENLYTLDRGITHTLIERGLDAIDIPHNATNKPPAYVKRLIADQEAVVQGLFDFVGRTRDLSTSYIKELHSQLTQSQKTTEGIDSNGRLIEIQLQKGTWKTLPNNPTRPDGSIHQYCPPEHVAAEIDQLMSWHLEHTKQDVPPEIEAAWLHHRFAQIHPFQDGNGRVARALATLVFLKAGWFPLVVLNDDRERYIRALEQADDDNLLPLVTFFSELARNSFVKAISNSGTIIEEQRARENVINAIKQTFISKALQGAAQTQNAKNNAFCLFNTATLTFNSTMSDVRTAINESYSGETPPMLDVYTPNENQWHFYKKQLVTIAKSLNYYVNIEQYHKWIRLRIDSESTRQCNIILSIHSVSRDFSGVMAATIFLEFRDSEPDNTFIDGPHLLCTEAFIFTGDDAIDNIRSKFEDWLQAALTKGLTKWHQEL